MPRRETGIPKEWERNVDKPFNAQIVSVHTGIMVLLHNKAFIFSCDAQFFLLRILTVTHCNIGEMREMDWFSMEFPKAE